MLGLIGKKIGQLRVYDAKGRAVSVTAVLAGPNRVVQCKTPEVDGYTSVQLGFGEQKESRLSKARQGHLKKHQAEPVVRLREFRDYPLVVKPGDLLSVDVFIQGDIVDAIGITKGKGFQGVVRRWKFGGGNASHGQKGWHRRPGAIGNRSTPGLVVRGKKLPGHMGRDQRTSQALEVIQVRKEDNLLLIKGAIPGANGDYVVICESRKHPRIVKK